MKRRTFLQRIGSILTVLGVTQGQWLTLRALLRRARYQYQALADPSQRKLALLIGINRYANNTPLVGCITDVELQRELLIHRFGFLPSNILTLTNEQANRKSIQQAFLAHLSQQAQPDDVVFFHFSGYGTRVKSGRFIDTVQNALVPTDDFQDAQKSQIVNYILEESLSLLLRSLPTDRVIGVLDTSYYVPDDFYTRGWGVRALPELPDLQLSIAELEFLQQLKSKNVASNSGVILSATSEPEQLAREVVLSGFSAGLFTYALTQYLWENIPSSTLQANLSSASGYIRNLSNSQLPRLSLGEKKPKGSLTIANLLLPPQVIGGEGTITAVEDDGKTAHLFLAGLPPQVLEHCAASRFTLDTGEELILRSRSGLMGKAQLSKVKSDTSLQPGQIFREAVRVLPRNINLTVALGTGLERIERVDATSAFAACNRIYTVMTTEQPADCIFGKLSEVSSRYALFTPAGQFISSTDGEPGEAVKLAVQRLAPKLPTFLAAKLWRLTENEGSSLLPVQATLEIFSPLSPQVVMHRQTARNLPPETNNRKSPMDWKNLTVPIGSRMQYRLQNQGDRPLYFMLLGLKNHRSAVAFYPWQYPDESIDSNPKNLFQNVIINPGQTLILPKNITASEWLIPGPAYECQHQLIFSTSAFSQTLASLEKSNSPMTDQRPFGSLLKPLEIAQALLQDLHNASIGFTDSSNLSPDSYILDVKNWASFNFNFQVV